MQFEVLLFKRHEMKYFKMKYFIMKREQNILLCVFLATSC